ncbi:FMRFamide receptor [Lepeophtheirus salmonis]|nr:FMRFamide receptor-like [Lepeophtheirus salmonis]XP_040583671.1 FMRFamide receptor-like [Lepeophtheirus salmonis]
MINNTFSEALNSTIDFPDEPAYFFPRNETLIALEKEKIEACGERINVSSSLITDFKFYGCGVTISILATAGTIGNILSFITIATLPKRNLFNKLLLTLTVFDTLFIVNGGIFMVQQAFQFNNSIYNMFFPWFIYPIAGIAMTGSTYTCIAIAFERFLGICYAHSDIPRHSRYYIIAITCISLIIDFPRFFEIGSTRVGEDGKVRFTYSELRKNELYLTFYILWFRLFSTAAVPFVLMLFFNYKILKHYRRNSFINNQNSNSFNNSNHEKSLYITFFCLTTTFLICHLPRVLLNIHELNKNHLQNYCKKVYDTNYNPPEWTYLSTFVEKILLIFNSSVNFIFYCLVGKRFRRHLLCLLLPKCCISRFFPSISSVMERESFMDSMRNYPLNHRHSSTRRGTMDYVISHPRGKQRTIIVDSIGDEEDERIIMEEEEEEEEEEEPGYRSKKKVEIVCEGNDEDAERLLDIRIQEKPEELGDKNIRSKSELFLYHDSNNCTNNNNSSCSSSLINNDCSQSLTSITKASVDNELLGIYDIRITIHRKQLGAAI